MCLTAQALLYASTDVAAQIQMRVISNCDPAARLIYPWITNWLVFEGQRQGDRVMAGGRTLSDLADSIYLYNPGEIGNGPKQASDWDTISVVRGKSVVASFPVIVQPLCELKTGLKNAAGGTVTVEGLLAYPKLLLSLPGCCLNARYNYGRVYRFAMVIVSKRHAEPVTASADSEWFTPEQLEYLRTLKPGDRITFTDINGGFEPNFCPRMFDPFEVTIR